MQITARFDGTVIIPDQPLDLPANQALVLRIDLADPVATDEPVLSWLAANAVDSYVLPHDLAHRHDHYLQPNSPLDPRK